MSDTIYVTRPYLPPLAEFLPLLEQIWDSRVLTNKGPFHAQLEARLCEYFEAEHVALMTNGMLALSVAIDAAALSGEIITTPYSFVATTHSVKMGQLEPVFVDVRPGDLNIDPDLIEAAITPRTSAIVAVHCYGNPCDVEAIQAIATRHGLKVIYDAAHAFGVRYRARSLLSYGDFSTLSFHATKAFNTFEGGAVVVRDGDANVAVDRFRNFGIADEVTIPAVGTNAKMSEFNAALGLLQLEHFEHVRSERRRVDALYRAELGELDGLDCLPIPADTEPNFSYFPILVGPEFGASRDALYEALKQQGVNSRRYFYPLLSTLPMYRGLPSAQEERLPVATRAAQRVLCLPIYPELSEGDQRRIIETIKAAR
ncbi:DegT/DnrJ/EryC1/StrS family aminotransferase [Sphingomonas parva]|uniref:DegT/DnrJ/EryC1/StrS family aminotransferase n=1 Tax=Sphingomonas parva TaxID=2555898 RepID=UPI00177E81B5|nr:DegT/DnrJ/EryC1/StrS family aminotransferase [Sphingomonas parva]